MKDMIAAGSVFVDERAQLPNSVLLPAGTTLQRVGRGHQRPF